MQKNAHDNRLWLVATLIAVLKKKHTCYNCKTIPPTELFWGGNQATLGF